MGTKNKPGAYDCYAAAHPDEPMFVLLGRDPSAAALVRLWCWIRDEVRPLDVRNIEKIVEAMACASAMEAWCSDMAHRLPAQNVLHLLPFEELATELRRRGATVTSAPHAGDGEPKSA